MLDEIKHIPKLIKFVKYRDKWIPGFMALKIIETLMVSELPEAHQEMVSLISQLNGQSKRKSNY